ncbi:hypothetical protein BDB01DRAFT_832684 [Pilobolus umbonatus]|nr:hypothetical protein BDB01DRAFT_832684 [Pilobolus umbonatus]
MKYIILTLINFFVSQIIAKPAPGCLSNYTVVDTDSCVSVAARFKLTEPQFYAMNPGLHHSVQHDCDNLDTGKPYCVCMTLPCAEDNNTPAGTPSSPTPSDSSTSSAASPEISMTSSSTSDNSMSSNPASSASSNSKPSMSVMTNAAAATSHQNETHSAKSSASAVPFSAQSMVPDNSSPYRTMIDIISLGVVIAASLILL